MFIIQYYQNPFHYKCSMSDFNTAQQLILNGKAKLANTSRLKTIAKGLKKIIKGLAHEYGFNASQFLTDNFHVTNSDYYVLRLNVQNPSLKSKQINNPWSCGRSNIPAIIKAIFKELKVCYSTQDITKDKMYKYYITVKPAPKATIDTDNSTSNKTKTLADEVRDCNDMPDITNTRDIHKLLSMISKLYDINQLQYLIQTKVQANNINMNKIRKHIEPLEHKLATLHKQQSILKQENQSILKPGPKSEPNTVITSSAPKTQVVANNNVSIQSKSSDNSLTKSQQFAYALFALWNHKSFETIKADYPDIKISKVLGKLTVLRHYTRRWQEQMNNKGVKTSFTIKSIQDISNLLHQYHYDCVTALKMYYNTDNYDTIKSIEDQKCLTHGTLLKLRKSKLGNTIKQEYLQKQRSVNA